MTEGTFSFDYNWLTDDNLITLSVEGYLRDDEVFDLQAYYTNGSQLDPIPATLDADLIDHIGSNL